ncbi:MAG: MBL fold metallo-hydrolase [Pseudomonadota bacterium]
MHFRLTALIPALAAASLAILPQALAQSADEPVSKCLAIAQNTTMPGVMFASMTASPLDLMTEDDDVTMTFAGHSTWVIETPDGVRIATDFSGFWGADPTPRIVTMNRAHSSHFTLNPSSKIEHVLPGWDTGNALGIDYDIVVDDVYVRNVTTDIRRWGVGDLGTNQNSIFIFEVAGLCIGHLGHLHHPLTEEHFREIGRLDVLMAPVDGGLTMSHAGMAELTQRLRSSVVLPMHLRGNAISSFINMMGAEWKSEFLDGDTITLNIRSLPKQPTIFVPQSLAIRG